MADLVVERFVGAKRAEQPAGHPADGRQVALVQLGQIINSEHGHRSFAQRGVRQHVRRVVAEPFGRVIKVTRSLLATLWKGAVLSLLVFFVLVLGS